METKTGWQLTRRAVKAWQDDDASSMGAALSYYTLFSIAPLLLIVISVAGLFFGDAAARGEIMTQLEGLMGEQGARAVEALLKSVNKPTEGIIATVAGVVALLVGATGVIVQLQNDLDRIWRAPPEKGGIVRLLRKRLLSFGLLLGFAFLLMVSLIVSAIVAALGKWWAPMIGGWELAAQLINFIVGFALMTGLFAMIFKIVPSVKIRWHDVWTGAAVTSALFSVGKLLIGLYLGKSSVASAFGAAGSLVLVMVWVYYSAQIFLLGAEFTWVYAHAYGSRQGQALPDGSATDAQADSPASTAPLASAELLALGAAKPRRASNPWLRAGLAAGAGFALALATRRKTRA